MPIDDDGRKKRIAIIGISSFLLVAMVLVVTVGFGLNEKKEQEEEEPPQIASKMKAIKDICQPTDYKQACIESINSTVDSNTTDPIILIKAAFNAAVIHIKKAANKSTTLQQLESEPRAKIALDQCEELMGHAVDEFNAAMNEIGKFDMTKTNQLLGNIKIWLSAAITYQETCLDGFQNTSSTAEDKMRTTLKLSMQLSSNGLAIVDQISTMLQQYNIPGINSRRLLQDEDLHVQGNGGIFPNDWISTGTRRFLTTHVNKLKPNIIVAQDGSGKYKTINEALKDVPKKSNKTFVIYIKEGIYNEYVQVNKSMMHLMFIGDGGTKTRITGNKNFIDGVTTFKTASIAVQADYFIARNIGFENTAGAIKHQAVALRVSGDMTIFYNCSIDGYQDTLYAHAKRQFYRDCSITGTIDFIFGDAAALFQNCTFLVRKPLDNQQCIITAQGRKERRQPTAIIIQNSTLTADADLWINRTIVRSYLGRPWKEYSRTIIMESYIDDLIQPDGWMPWLEDFGLNTCFYTEYNNWGPGSGKAKRVRWPGIKSITTAQAKRFTAKSFIDGDIWIKHTGVPYHSNLFTKDVVTMETLIEQGKANAHEPPVSTNANEQEATDETSETSSGKATKTDDTHTKKSSDSEQADKKDETSTEQTEKKDKNSSKSSSSEQEDKSDKSSTDKSSFSEREEKTDKNPTENQTSSEEEAIDKNLSEKSTSSGQEATTDENPTDKYSNDNLSNGIAAMTINGTTNESSSTTNVTSTGNVTTGGPTSITNLTSIANMTNLSTILDGPIVEAIIAKTNATISEIELENSSSDRPVAKVNVTLISPGGNGTNVTIVGQVDANKTTLGNTTSGTPITIANATIIAPGNVNMTSGTPITIENGSINTPGNGTTNVTIVELLAAGLLNGTGLTENGTSNEKLEAETTVADILSIANATALGLLLANSNTATVEGLVTKTNEVAAQAEQLVQNFRQ
ncbi:hypothetical protein ACFE04_006822 [Oxalis oulophora]